MKAKNVRGALAMATCSLLGANAVAGDGDWKVDTALLYYGEQDRVSAVEPVVKMRRELAEEEFLDIKLVLDGLTGPSHNGAPVRPYAQTFTTPSGNQQYTVPAGEVPLDEEFHDTRGQVSVTWDRPLANRLWRSSLGGNISKEFDFASLGVSGTLSRDFNKRNTTVVGGLSFENDIIQPVGGVPVPLALMDLANPTAGKTQGDESKTVTDVLLGVTQVIDRNTIMQFNYNLSLSSGYQNDPYKIVADGSVAAAPGAFYFESRPDSRTKHSLYWETKHALANGDVVNGSYRFMTDDWGIASHTIDLRYRWQMAPNWFLEPHARWYSQSEADFFVEAMPAAPVAGTHVTSDYRLGALTDTTFGFKVGKTLGEDREASFRLESFQQSGDSDVADLSAIIVEFGYSFRW